MPQGTAPHPSQSAVELMGMPSLDSLTEHQVRGGTCVWDGVPLALTTAVDLGAHVASRAGEPVTWYPRACRSCVEDRARRALYAHAPGCKECTADVSTCDRGQGLNRLLRKARG
ncbi:hypothetical protein [Streptomyces sp. NPDC002952]|uniref:hypothetical protein n=1 Tax=Streptomyces sp. NPDC002952 TaxID=3364673 RepID=UPI0036B285E2